MCYKTFIIILVTAQNAVDMLVLLQVTDKLTKSVSHSVSQSVKQNQKVSEVTDWQNTI